MPQLHLYVSDDLAAAIRTRAAAQQRSISGYLAEVVRREVNDTWPAGFFDQVVGGWQGEALERPPQGELERRDPL